LPVLKSVHPYANWTLGSSGKSAAGLVSASNAFGPLPELMSRSGQSGVGLGKVGLDLDGLLKASSAAAASFFWAYMMPMLVQTTSGLPGFLAAPPCRRLRLVELTGLRRLHGFSKEAWSCRLLRLAAASGPFAGHHLELRDLASDRRA
jgi:hypothetical protein